MTETFTNASDDGWAASDASVAREAKATSRVERMAWIVVAPRARVKRFGMKLTGYRRREIQTRFAAIV